MDVRPLNRPPLGNPTRRLCGAQPTRAAGWAMRAWAGLLLLLLAGGAFAGEIRLPEPDAGLPIEIEAARAPEI